VAAPFLLPEQEMVLVVQLRRLLLHMAQLFYL